MNGESWFLMDGESLYETAPYGFIVIGRDGLVLKANKTLCAWLDMPTASIVGSAFSDLLSVPGQIFNETHFQPLLRMQGYVNEIALDLVTSSGVYIPVLANAVECRDIEERLLFTQIVCLQASMRRRHERELIEARAGAERARQELQDVNRNLEEMVSAGMLERLHLQRGLSSEQEMARLREQFMAILGHDLRNPLSSIVGGLRLLAKDAENDRSRRVIEMMQSSTSRMFSLIHDMLDFTRLRSGSGIGVDLVYCDLAPSLQQVVEELRTAHPQRLIESRVSLRSHVLCDPARIAQVVSNLLANALHHGSSDGPVWLDAASQEDGYALISVSNVGTPIPKDVRERLFQPFFRAEVGSEGLGLGLYIACEIVRSHGGRLEVSSDEAATRFFFNIPTAATSTPVAV